MTTARLLAATLAAVMIAPVASAQLLLNEANAVGVNTDTFVQTGEIYEGYDFGILPYSGNSNPPLSGAPRGNPFPADVDSATTGNQTTLPNGWDGSTGWARIQFNGGDWIELVVTEDMADLRGYTLYWENIDTGSSIGETAGDRGAMKFTNDPIWNNLRAGTIITISEDDSANEIRDSFPEGPVQSFLNDTGHDYDLSTDGSYDLIGNRSKAQAIADILTAGNSAATNDVHIHVHLDESLTDNGIATQYFEANSDIKVDNDAWRFAIFNDSNTALTPTLVESEVDRSALDLTTGMVGEFVGESAPDYGDNTGGGGVNNQELLIYHGPVGSDNALTLDSTSESEDYEDVDFSTFGRINLFNDQVESTLDGAQDLTALYAWLNDLVEGDANYDGAVDTGDLAILAGNFGTLGGVTWIGGNFNGDGNVDTGDLAILAGNFGATAPVAAAASAVVVPEPAAGLLAAIGLLAAAARRRQTTDKASA
ncbi:MAG: PEP-CTERM sorting domain-containing protein [Planctomycetota bacterium]